MSECPTSVNAEVRDPDQESTAPVCGNSSEKAVVFRPPQLSDTEGNKQGDPNCLQDVDEEEDEDEDVDFNPLLKEAHSVEASSSLSSDIEDMDADAADSGANTSVTLVKNSNEKHRDTIKDCQPNVDFEQGGDILVQTTVSSGEVCGKNSIGTYDEITEKSELISQSENFLLFGKENESTSLTNVNNAESSGKMVVDVDSEGAIWMRTRARYSLASFTLDELETFLQETDDEDDLQNVDDEEEYRKFLAAVLQGDNCENLQGNVTAEDEDEDEENDADFELELEEALESDPDEIEERRMSRRNRHQKASPEYSKKHSEQLNRPLRPLLPFSSVASSSAFEENKILPNIAPSSIFPANNGLSCGFTPFQIGQLHCLIHEHVQLLIQIFSVSVLDPAKGHIASTLKDLILEMVKNRDQKLSQRTVPHPSFCFFPPYVHPSVTDECRDILPLHDSNNKVQGHFPSGSIRQPQFNVFSMPNEPYRCRLDENAGSSQTQECNSWVPYICGPVLSVTDVAPLRLAGQFIDDVASAVQAHKRRQIELALENKSEKEPLFPLHISPCSAESDGQEGLESSPQASHQMLSSSPNNHIPKKTMAATLVEKAKRQSVALVPKEIAKQAQRFWPLFNPALYPHKPPPAPIANRVLFTDSEDELLALGMMEYNTDWKAIQQRFLPCKSKHQIFVRQKNRASSKAPENPIKAVRRMKNSPLTSEEIASIEAGLKKFKLDWISIWRFLVPYRDPSLLPRQWRIASGTQKSYKADANKKAKRRLYDARNRVTNLSSRKEHDGVDSYIGETNSGDEYIDKQDEAYVHEAFLAYWRPGSNVSPSCPTSLPSQLSSKFVEQKEKSGFGELQPQTCSNSQAALRSCSSQIVLRPYRARRAKTSRLVKLAPGLPPVNLPPSVRVMSQSAFRNCQAETSTKVPFNAPRIGGMVVGNGGKKIGSTSSRITADHEPMKHSEAENRDNSHLQMHPLFLQTLQDGHLSYYPPKYGSTCNSSPFFPGKQPQLNLSLFHNPRHIRDAMTYLSKSSKPLEKNSSSDVDFHPLFHSMNAIDEDRAASSSANAASRQICVSIENSSCAARSKPSIGDGSMASGERINNIIRKENLLELDINLNVASNDLKPAGKNNTSISMKNLIKRKDSAPREVGDKVDAIDPSPAALTSSGNAEVTDIMHDESLSGIIMEQEELSDSDEEFGENVEFEHEEMDDSGEDTSDEEQIVHVPNEEVQGDEEDVCKDLQTVHGENTCGPSDAALDLAANGVNETPNSLSFNLNSHPPFSPYSDPKNAAASYDLGSFGATGKLDQGQHPAASKLSTRRKRVNDATNQPSVGSGSTSVRKNRKRVCRLTLNSGITGSGNVRSSLDKDLNVDNSKKNVKQHKKHAEEVCASEQKNILDKCAAYVKSFQR